MKKQVAQLQQVYKWKQGTRASVKPEVAAKAIEKIRQDLGGTCTPSDLLKAAKRKTHPLHNEFTWDDSVAAEAYRKRQARYLINHLDVVVTKPDAEGEVERSFTVRKYTSIGFNENATFYDTRAVLSDEELKTEAMRKVWNQLLSLRRQYADMVELQEVWDAIDNAQGEQVRAVG